MEALIEKTIPSTIRIKKSLQIGGGIAEKELLDRLRAIASKNKVYKSYIGLGYYNTIVPPVVLRNILENPQWYTQYTPYQPEIAQGRLESLLNYQTMVTDLTGMDIANASLLDEGTAAAEAMIMCYSAAKKGRNTFFVDKDVHPQTIACIKTRAEGFDIQVIVGDLVHYDFEANPNQLCGVLIQYPTTDGRIIDYKPYVDRAHAAGAQVACATDLLALVRASSPGVHLISSHDRPCSSLLANSVATLHLETVSALACHLDSVDRMLHSLLAKMLRNVVCLVVWSVYPRMRAASKRFA